MAAYAQTTFTSSVKLAGLLLVLAAVAAVLVAAFEQISRGFYLFVLSWRGLAFSIVFASLYLATRKFLAHVRL